MKKERITQNEGPTIEFVGEQIAETVFETTGNYPMEVGFEIWRTEGGALIAASSSYPIDRKGVEVTHATVVEPMADEQVMHFAVLDHFRWHDRAKSMVRKLKWKTTRKVA